MSSYILSAQADRDIRAIFLESIKQWGLAMAEKYVAGLHDSCRLLAEFPEMGRDAGAVRLGYMRMKAASHLIFYLKEEKRIRIIRVLHERMDFQRYL